MIVTMTIMMISMSQGTCLSVLGIVGRQQLYPLAPPCLSTLCRAAHHCAEALHTTAHHCTEALHTTAHHCAEALHTTAHHCAEALHCIFLHSFNSRC